MELAYDRCGHGPPLVLLHGVGHRRQAWDPVVGALVSEREVVTVDFPGFGQSPPLPDSVPYALDSLVDVLAAFFDQLGLDRPHVGGNSMGGLVALALARHDLVRSATALSPAGLWTARQRAWTLMLLRGCHRVACRTSPVTMERLVRTPAGRAVLTSVVVARPWLLDPQVVLEDARALAGAPAFVPTLAAAEHVMFEDPIAGVPVTIAWGDRDRLLRRPPAAMVTALIPQVELVRLPGCGHVPMTDDPLLVAQVLLDGSNVTD
ncbi:MAG: alpha/beta fold hydrolase [Actinobacteria bacterium]|nr:alpha/beta fold hydrolase [Actinomycetota bacterium]